MKSVSPAVPRPIWPLVLVGLALVVGLLARLGTADEVFDFAMPHAFSEDDHYHLRRIVYALRTGQMLDFDPFMSFPHGAYSWFTNGFDGILIALCRWLVGPGASVAEVLAVCIVAIPLLSLLSLPLVYLLGKRLASREAGAFAALIVAVLPAHAFAGFAGIVDHHCLETALSLLPLLILADALRGATRRPLWRNLVCGALAGAATAMSLYFWSGAPLVWSVIVTALALGTLGASAAGWRSLTPVLVAFAGALVAVTVHAVGQAPLGHQGPYVMFIVSRFHLVFAALLAAGVILWIAVGAVVARKSNLTDPARAVRHLLLFAVTMLGCAAALAVWRGFGVRDLAEATAFIRSEGLVAWIEETAPLWRDWHGAFGHFSLLLLVVPAYLLWRGWRAFQARHTAPDAALLEVAGLLFMAFSFLQFRHKVHFVPFFAVGVVRLAGDVQAWLVARNRLPPRTATLLVALVVIVAMLQPIQFLSTASLGRASTADVLVACDFIRDHTPQAAPPYRVGAQPTYGVLGVWDIGKTIAGVCERPSLGSPDAYGEQLKGVLDLMRFFATDDVATTQKILDDYRVRYVLVSPQYFKHWETSIAMLGLPRADYLTAENAFTERVAASAYARLYSGDGAALAVGDRRLPALSDLRLVFESRAYDGETAGPHAKVYERVQGATLIAHLTPREKTVIDANVRLNSGRTLAYVDFATADDNGWLHVRFPYRTDVRVRTPSRLYTATVTAADEGKEVLLH